jgi:hypothetical protein
MNVAMDLMINPLSFTLPVKPLRQASSSQSRLPRCRPTRPVLVMLTDSQYRPITVPFHDTPDRSQPLSQLQHLALNRNRLALDGWSKVRDVQTSCHARVFPRVFAGKRSHTCRIVEESCYRATVGVFRGSIVAA